MAQNSCAITFATNVDLVSVRIASPVQDKGGQQTHKNGDGPGRQLRALWPTASPPHLRLASSVPDTTTLFPQIVSASFSVVLRYPPPQAPRASGLPPRPRV